MMGFKRNTWALMSVMLMLAVPLAAQDSDEVEDADEVTDADAAEGTADEAVTEEAEIEEEGLDQQGFDKEDEDDFIPTEQIGSDQSIPFPTDI